MPLILTPLRELLDRLVPSNSLVPGAPLVPGGGGPLLTALAVDETSLSLDPLNEGTALTLTPLEEDA